MSIQRHYFILDTQYMEITQSIEMGYNQIRVGMIGPKKRGVMMCNEKNEVRGDYPLDLLPAIEMILTQKAKLQLQ